MDPIDLLIRTLAEQRQRNASASQLLQTVQQLQTALQQASPDVPAQLGTAKIAVMMPLGTVVPVSVAPVAVAPVAVAPVSVNEVLTEKVADRSQQLQQEPIRDLRKAIDINDRYLLLNELFDGDESRYEQVIKTLNGFSILGEALFYVDREIKTRPGYDKDGPAAQLLAQLLSRRFS